MAGKKKSTSIKRQGPTSYQRKIREFRHQVSVLKKQGLISSKIDARRAKPTAALNKDIKKFLKVITGEAKALKITFKRAKEYRAQGYETRKNRIILPTNLQPQIITRGKRKGLFRTKRPVAKGHSISSTAFSTPVDNLDQFIADIRDNPEYELRDGEYWAFKFHGWNSSQVFSTLDALQAFIERYQSFAGSPDKQPTRDELAETIRNLEIVQISPDEAKSWYAQNNEFKKRERKKRVKIRKLRTKPESPVSRAIRLERDKLYHRNKYDKAKSRDAKRKQRAKRDWSKPAKQ